MKEGDWCGPSKETGQHHAATSLDQLPEDLRKMWEANHAANLQALLSRCSLDRCGNVYKEQLILSSVKKI